MDILYMLSQYIWSYDMLKTWGNNDKPHNSQMALIWLYPQDIIGNFIWY